MPMVLGDIPPVKASQAGNDKVNPKGSVTLSKDFHSKPSFIQFSAPQRSCPFEVLRAFKYQNTMTKASSKTCTNGIQLSAVTGYANEISKQEHESVFSYNILFANTSNIPVRILGHNIAFKHDGKELKSEYYEGVNNTIPLIAPGEHYICGATVAFPEELEDLTFSGSFTIMEDVQNLNEVKNNPKCDISGNNRLRRSREFAEFDFEGLPLEQKYRILTERLLESGKEGKGGNTRPIKSFTAELPDTKFVFDVFCDTQPLAEKFSEVDAGEKAEVHQY